MLIFGGDSKYSVKQLSELHIRGDIRRVYHRIYTDDLNSSLEEVVAKHWMQIVSYIVPNGILSFRTSHDLQLIKFSGRDNIVFVISTYGKTINLPGLIIKVIKGNNDLYIEQVLPTLARSNTPRMLLENLSVVRGSQYHGIKTIEQKGVEKFLVKELKNRGEEYLNKIRDDAKKISLDLNFGSEYKKLNRIIGSLLSTNDKNFLEMDYSKAIAINKPYDLERMDLFEKLSIFLQKSNFINRTSEYKPKPFKNMSFYEAYFSNFIEGTEFEINEAEDIVFSGVEINNRHEDSHDVLATFQLTNDYLEMIRTPESSEDFIDIIQSRHALLMHSRKNIDPGNFKQKSNKAGNTHFVLPIDVVGTLVRAFDIYKGLQPGMCRALFMQFVISEVHPFNDGNGRLARIMMNSELVNAGLTKIMVPTVMRDNYLNGLRLVSRDANFLTYCKVMDQSQSYSHSLPVNDFMELRDRIESDHADRVADEGLPKFYRVLRKTDLSAF